MSFHRRLLVEVVRSLPELYVCLLSDGVCLGADQLRDVFPGDAPSDTFEWRPNQVPVCLLI
jgi:hypothetical protein